MSERSERLREAINEAAWELTENPNADAGIIARAICEELGVTEEAAEDVAWLCEGRPWANAFATLLEASKP